MGKKRHTWPCYGLFTSYLGSFFLLFLSIGLLTQPSHSAPTWLNGFKKEWPVKTCASIPLECWNISKKQCERDALTPLNECLSLLKRNLTKAPKDDVEKTKLGQTIGSCAGRRLETHFEKTYKKQGPPEKCDSAFAPK